MKIADSIIAFGFLCASVSLWLTIGACPMVSSRRTVITGLGIVTPLGLHTAATWEAVRAGRSGIRPIQSFDARNLPVRFGGEVLDFDLKAFIPKENKDGR